MTAPSCPTKGLTIALKMSRLGQEPVRQVLSCSGAWVDWRSGPWGSLPEENRRIIWRDKPPQVSHRQTP